MHSTKLNVAMRDARLMSLASTQIQALYAVDDRFDFLEVADVIGVEGTDGRRGSTGEPTLIQITHKRTMLGKAFLESLVDDPTLMHEVPQQIGREVAESDHRSRAIDILSTRQGVRLEPCRPDSSPPDPTNSATFQPLPCFVSEN